MVAGNVLRLFVVEDSDILLEQLLDILGSKDGVDIVGHADSAERAIARIAATLPDVIVLDLNLRTGHGFDVLKWLQANPIIPQPLKIVLTNYSLPEYRSTAVRLGADYFFDKSFEIWEAFAMIEQLAQRRQDVA